jgi:hypothetical protein
MRHLLTIITRDGSGPLRIVADRAPREHSDNHAELDQILAERQIAGDDMVLILGADDSVMRHWTRPPNQVVEGAEPDQGEDTLGERPRGRGARRHVAKKAAKRKAKR